MIASCKVTHGDGKLDVLTEMISQIRISKPIPIKGGNTLRKKGRNDVFRFTFFSGFTITTGVTDSSATTGLAATTGSRITPCTIVFMMFSLSFDLE
jgi:hypothetical protein